MAENSKITWTDDTVNVWLGCQHVVLHVAGVRQPSECDNCYAEWLVRHRMGYNGRDAAHPEVWGNPKTTPRVETKYWRKALIKWNRQALGEGRLLVFAFSLSDWAEEHPMVTPWRNDFLQMVEDTPWLDYLLLTKRPQNALRMAPQSWKQNWPKHVWMGTSAGNQAAWNRRVRYLYDWAAVGVPVRFVSDEPTLGPIDPGVELSSGLVNWVITGGESGPDEGYDRPRVAADMSWFYDMRDACLSAGVAFFHKQMSARRPGTGTYLDGREWHQWPDTMLGVVGGVRSRPGAQL